MSMSVCCIHMFSHLLSHLHTHSPFHSLVPSLIPSHPHSLTLSLFSSFLHQIHDIQEHLRFSMLQPQAFSSLRSLNNTGNNTPVSVTSSPVIATTTPMSMKQGLAKEQGLAQGQGLSGSQEKGKNNNYSTPNNNNNNNNNNNHNNRNSSSSSSRDHQTSSSVTLIKPSPRSPANSPPGSSTVPSSGPSSGTDRSAGSRTGNTSNTMSISPTQPLESSSLDGGGESTWKDSGTKDHSPKEQGLGTDLDNHHNNNHNDTHNNNSKTHLRPISDGANVNVHALPGTTSRQWKTPTPPTLPPPTPPPPRLASVDGLDTLGGTSATTTNNSNNHNNSSNNNNNNNTTTSETNLINKLRTFLSTSGKVVSESPYSRFSPYLPIFLLFDHH